MVTVANRLSCRRAGCSRYDVRWVTLALLGSTIECYVRCVDLFVTILVIWRTSHPWN
jgi:hypothetical protein